MGSFIYFIGLFSDNIDCFISALRPGMTWKWSPVFVFITKLPDACSHIYSGLWPLDVICWGSLNFTMPDDIKCWSASPCKAQIWSLYLLKLHWNSKIFLLLCSWSAVKYFAVREGQYISWWKNWKDDWGRKHNRKKRIREADQLVEVDAVVVKKKGTHSGKERTGIDRICGC